MVDFADIQAVAHPVLRHRLVLNFHARADNVDADTLAIMPDDEVTDMLASFFGPYVPTV